MSYKKAETKITILNKTSNESGEDNKLNLNLVFRFLLIALGYLH